MFDHFVFVDDGADGQANRRRAAQRLGFPDDGGRDLGEIAFGGFEEVLALAAALAGQIRVATNNQPLAGKLSRRQRRQVAIVEQRHLQIAAADQRCSAGARGAVIQSSFAGRNSSSMRVCVIMPLSPTNTTWWRANCFLNLDI
jgi:hypothetical protein